MNYFVIKVKVGKEADVLARTQELFINQEIKVFWLRRELSIRKQGKIKEVLAPLFPGYLIIEAETVSPQLFRVFKQINGFSNFLTDRKSYNQSASESANLALLFALR